jgi:hypothetical protein
MIGNLIYLNRRLPQSLFYIVHEADEAFFAGDKASLGVLKAIVTERVLTIEAKHVNAVQCANMLHIMMASNNEWVVPAALDERRFFVLDVSDDRKGHHDYFGAIHAEMGDGGYEAMLDELLTYDLSRFNVRDVPKTSALQDQKKRSLDLKLSWWREVLMCGYVFRSELGLEDDFGQWNGFESTEVLFAPYLDYATARGERHLMSRKNLANSCATWVANQSARAAGSLWANAWTAHPAWLNLSIRIGLQAID